MHTDAASQSTVSTIRTDKGILAPDVINQGFPGFVALITRAPAMLEAGIAVGGVCLSAQNLKNYWSEIDVT